MSPQLQTLKEAQAVIADLSPMDQDLVKSIAGQYRAILDTEGECAVMAFALVGAEIAAAARFRNVVAVSAPTEQDGLVIVGFRARRPGGPWQYVDSRDPDSFEIRECEIQNIYAGFTGYGRWPEVITWTAARMALPDSDVTVLLDMPDEDSEPVWPGYHDGERWLLGNGMPAPRVRAWAHIPAGLNAPQVVSVEPKVSAAVRDEKG